MRLAHTFAILFAVQCTSMIADEAVKSELPGIEIQLREIDLKVHLNMYEKIATLTLDPEMEISMLDRDDSAAAEKRKQLTSKRVKLIPYGRFIKERARTLSRKIRDGTNVAERDSSSR